ncbi:MAG: BACON domain-containing protein, partial [Thermodesulfobacteriota bacterium]|nr:BACON domain-containing protein [Thermodesulfobacteriota bacterium]
MDISEELSVTPDSQTVNYSAGTATFNVNNTGSGTMPWTASVISGKSWLSIASGSSGTDSGTITVAFSANASGLSRTGTIRVTASGADGSPKDVTVVQSSQDDAFVSGWRYTRADVAGSCYYSWGSTELTENTLQEKFSINNAYGSVLTGDVTGNGHLEIIYVSGDQLKIYDGTGNMLHSVTLGSSS